MKVIQQLDFVMNLCHKSLQRIEPILFISIQKALDLWSSMRRSRMITLLFTRCSNLQQKQATKWPHSLSKPIFLNTHRTQHKSFPQTAKRQTLKLQKQDSTALLNIKETKLTHKRKVCFFA